MPPLVALLLQFVQPMLQGIAKLWEQYGEKALIYFKGKADQRRIDNIRDLDRQASESTKANERMQDVQEKADERRRDSSDFSDVFGVRKP